MEHIAAKPSSYNLWRLPTVIAKTTLSQATIYRLMREGDEDDEGDEEKKADKFPLPIKIGPRAVAWRSDEVEAFIESRARSRVGNAESFYTVANDAA